MILVSGAASSMWSSMWATLRTVWAWGTLMIRSLVPIMSTTLAGGPSSDSSSRASTSAVVSHPMPRFRAPRSEKLASQSPSKVMLSPRNTVSPGRIGLDWWIDRIRVRRLASLARLTRREPRLASKASHATPSTPSVRSRRARRPSRGLPSPGVVRPVICR